MLRVLLMSAKPYNRPNGDCCPWIDKSADPEKECGRKSVGNSKFCAIHRSAARTRARKVWAERFAEAEARRQENQMILAAIELVAETAERSKPAPCPCILWVPSGVGSFQCYLRKVADFKPAEVASKGIEKPVGSLSYAVAFQQALKEHGTDCRVIL